MTDTRERLQCFAYGSTIQSELWWADHEIETIERLSSTHGEDDPLMVGEVAYRESRESVLREHREVLKAHMERAYAALSNATSCGVPSEVTDHADLVYEKVKSQVNEGDYSNARMNLNQLRAQLRHPERKYESR